MEWDGKHRSIGRFVLRFILDRFDAVADWLDGRVMIFGASLERWTILNVIVCAVSCAIWALYVGWLKALVLGPLIYLLFWMAFTWFL